MWEFEYETSSPMDRTWIDDLDDLQAGYNNGRGVSCVRSVIIYLAQGNNDAALNTVLNEFDKIRNYPPIVKMIGENLEGVKYCARHVAIFPRLCISCKIEDRG